MAGASPDRIRPLAALRAVSVLLRHPDDTARVFEVIDALGGRSRARLFARFRSRDTGRRLLDERPDLLAALSDRDGLAVLPAGSLGRHYLEFMARERLSAGGLVEASAQVRREDLPPERRYFAGRMRDMHDLWHVITGYDRDLLGESALLAFTYAQTRNPGIGFLVATAWWKLGRAVPGTRTLLRAAHRRGRRAAWLPEQPWEELLPLPLGAVREHLRVGAPPEYDPLPPAGAPAPA